MRITLSSAPLFDIFVSIPCPTACCYQARHAREGIWRFPRRTPRPGFGFRLRRIVFPLVWPRVFSLQDLKPFHVFSLACNNFQPKVEIKVPLKKGTQILAGRFLFCCYVGHISLNSIFCCFHLVTHQYMLSEIFIKHEWGGFSHTPFFHAAIIQSQRISPTVFSGHCWNNVLSSGWKQFR